MIKAAERWKSRGPSTDGARRSKDQGDDLLLFKDMIKRDKERGFSLLQPAISEEFETQYPIAGSNSLYRIPSRKGVYGGNELLSVGADKNDYDWLKTPPATPLFPSLEMEAGGGAGAEWMMQREIPLLQPIRTSRFSTRPAEPKTVQASGPEHKKPPLTRPKVIGPKPTGSITKSVHASDGHKIKPALITAVKHGLTEPIMKPTNSPKPMVRTVDDPKPKPCGSSPAVRSRIPAKLPGFTSEAPPNLRTSPATRGRPAGQPTSKNAKEIRQSCSPSTARGRKLPELGKNEGIGYKERVRPALVVGSKMVERVVNARKAGRLGDEEKDSGRREHQLFGSAVAGYGRNISRGALMDSGFKNMEIKGGYSTNAHHYNALISRKPASVLPRNHQRSIGTSSSATNEDDEETPNN